MPPTVILIAGPPASGKTTLARYLAAELRLPLFYKDLYKEILFDTLGARDRPWSRRLGVASVNLLFASIETELRAGRSFIAESTFKPDLDGPRWAHLQVHYAFRCLQIQCRAHGDVLRQRFLDRESSPERHPGHSGRDHLDELDTVLARGRHDPIELDCDLIWLDTTDLSVLDLTAILDRARHFMWDQP